ncbi:MAG: DNA mismatch repair protein MutS, partial [Flavobacteriaceae bacterium]|nr:DNA mismatch repair protein MutS [Flavobacteriaceae bacterium]
HLMPYEKLQLQLNTAEEALLSAYRKHIDRVVLIHGLGSGKLRDALTSVYAKFEGLAVYDAAYAEFGRGATEVKLYLKRFKRKE